jgi:isoquinoline 1-oxidoreductase beta subunit
VGNVARRKREAAAIAKRLRGTPVKLVWSREDDISGGYYRPMHAHRVEVGIASDGMPIGWRHVVVGQSIAAGTAFEAATGWVSPFSGAATGYGTGRAR